MKANAMGFYPIVGEGVISFPENTKIESFNEFLRAIRAVIMITKRLSWYSPYSPDLNPIEFIWKSIKRGISIVFVENVEALRKNNRKDIL